jgi:acetyl-CoA acetyltransferase
MSGYTAPCLHAMQKRDKTLGLATLYGGGGVSMATALERV